ncbi:MAG: hypothetical protein AVDCRST_MAG19-4990, partial [uncultured Thermomicrobiales bacterium]
CPSPSSCGVHRSGWAPVGVVADPRRIVSPPSVGFSNPTREPDRGRRP